MTLNKEIIITIVILFFANILVWFQLNGQLKWEWWKDNVWFVCLLGMPLSYMFFKVTTIGYEGFGALWPIRLLGFATGMLTFPILTYLLLGEGITLKTGISILLSIVILLLQLI
tara:strand:- start:464 stop:805 length:342 start_codon:yes stop_codon:yes gene_type:complete